MVAMNSNKRKILLVDDEPSIIKTVGKRLEIEGFEVIIAMDGEEALAKAQSEKPDLVVLDLMLPKVNGFDVCAQLKKDRQSKEIPVVTIFSGRGSEEDKDQCLALGAAAYVTKGRGASELIQQIKALLGK